MAVPPQVLPNTVDNTNATNSNVNQNKDDNTLDTVTVTATQIKVDAAGNLKSTDEITPQPNILDRFASYTYSASVYLLSRAQYERFITNKKKNINGYFLLFQSGGAPVNKGGFLGKGTGTVNGIDPSAEGLNDPEVEDFGRSPSFPLDFYIDSITIDNALPGKQTQAAHMVTDLKFTVVEPGNITLLDRLYRAVQDANQVDKDTDETINYTAAAYMMIIRWYGYDINGNLVKVGAADPKTGITDPNAVVEKYIPFIIKSIDWQVSSKLVTYEFDCQPIGQWIAGGTRRATIPYDAEFSASTVGELLGNKLQFVSANQTGTATNAASLRAAQDTAAGNTAAPAKAIAAPTSNLVVKQGLMGAMNEYQQKLVKDGIYKQADTYSIEFGVHPDFPNRKIADATLRLTGNVVTQSNTSMGVAASQNANQALNTATNPMDIKNRKWSVTAGTQIVQIIDQAIRKSSYIFDQQLTTIDQTTNEDTTQSNIAQRPTLWYNISFEAVQGKYDSKRNDYAYDITFFVTPYPLQNFESKYFPLTRFRGIHKSYPYWFTGQNTAVLDFTAKFNSYYNILVTGKEAADSQAARLRQLYTSSMREIPFYTAAPSSTQDRQGEESRALEAQASAASYLYSPGDMGTASLRIIGDPAWIQQGTLSNGVSVEDFSYGPFNADGTINFDAEQVMFEISWQRPSDYNLTTGLADPYNGADAKNRMPIQSTVYQAFNVRSEFRQGKFEQTIEGGLFFYPKPDGTNTVGKSAATNNNGLGANNSHAETNESAAETARLARQNAQTVTTAASNFNNDLYKNIQNSPVLTNTGTRPATQLGLISVGNTETPSAPVTTETIAPSRYPQAPTGSGVVPIRTTESAPEPLNVNPYATAGRTQTIVRES